jgi:hypothetical protein
VSERWYSVAVRGTSPDASPDVLERVAEVTQEVGGWEGPIVSAGEGFLGLRATVLAPDPATAVTRMLGLFAQAVRAADIEIVEIYEVEAQTEEYQERHLADQEPESYAGVSEIADMLGVSKQRVGQLRQVEGFPTPVAELAAGPVWRVSTLRRFVEEWPRRPGRPRKDESSKVVDLEQRLHDGVKETRAAGAWTKKAAPRSGATGRFGRSSKTGGRRARRR